MVCRSGKGIGAVRQALSTLWHKQEYTTNIGVEARLCNDSGTGGAGMGVQLLKLIEIIFIYKDTVSIILIQLSLPELIFRL